MQQECKGKGRKRRKEKEIKEMGEGGKKEKRKEGNVCQIVTYILLFNCIFLSTSLFVNKALLCS